MEYTQLQLRRDSAANWTSEDPILADGERGIETDTLKKKDGDGVTAWTSLDYNYSGLAQAEFAQLENIGTSTISATQWGYLGALNQALATTNNVTFAQITGTGTINTSGKVQEDGIDLIQDGMIGDINSPLVDYDLLHDTRKIVRGEGSDTFTRSTIQNIVDRYGVIQEIAIDNSGAEKNGTKFAGPSTNLCLQSQTLDTTWTKDDCTISSDAVDAPDGTTTADKIVEASDTAQVHYIYQATTPASAGTYTMSCFAKFAERDIQILYYNATDGNIENAYFDLSAGTATGDGTIEELADGWYRCSITGTQTVASSTNIYTVLSGTTTKTYDGDGSSGVYVWGAQVEELPFASSYITTVASAVTRTVNLASLPYAGNFPAPADDMTIIVDVTVDGVVGSANYIFSVAGETSRLLRISSTNKILCFYGGNYAESTTVITAKQTYRIGYVNDGTNVYLYIDGILEDSTAQGTVTGAATGNVAIGALTGGANPLYGNIKNLRVWDRALTAAQMRIA